MTLDNGPKFGERLTVAVRRCRTPLIVGLDPQWDLLPEALRAGRDGHNLTDVSQAVEEFCRRVLEAVGDLVPAVKPQVAFFEALGPEGIRVLHSIVQQARRQGVMVILDGKRNDIGSTAAGYARAYLSEGASPIPCNALTVNPYLGVDGLRPFLDVAVPSGNGIFVLVKTSNPSGGQVQDLWVDRRPLYAHIADLVESLSQEYSAGERFGSCGAVVGATYPRQLLELREQLPHCWLLVPGYGAQGGTARDVAGAFLGDGLGAVINSSRAIIYAHARQEYRELGTRDWQRAVEQATRDTISELAAETAAGRLLP